MECTILAQDIDQKLSGCFFRYKGFPYYVKRDGAVKLALYKPSDLVRGLVSEYINFQDPDFDISSIPLGYINSGEWSVSYLVRMPIRRVRQGVCDVNVRVNNLDGTTRDCNAHNLMSTKAFEDMVMGEYPPLDKVITELRNAVKSPSKMYPFKKVKAQVAIHRDIALETDFLGLIKVYYKQEYIGYVEPRKDVVNVVHESLGWVVSHYLSSVFSQEKIN